MMDEKKGNIARQKSSHKEKHYEGKKKLFWVGNFITSFRSLAFI